MSKKHKPPKKNVNIMRSNPQKAANLANEAIEFCRCGDYKNGIRLFKKAEERDRKNPQIILNLGVAYHAIEDFPAARKCYSRAMRLKPDYVVKILQNGINDLALNRLESAECGIGAVRDIDPGNITVQLATGSLLLRRGEKEAGAEILRKCYSTDPKMTSAIVELAEFSLITAEDMENIQNNITLGAVDRKNTKFMQLALGKGYQLQSNYKAAFECFSAANEEFAREAKLTNLQAANDLEAHMAVVREVITPELIQKFAAPGQDDEKLVFIVGLPRSGLHDVAYMLQESGTAVIAGEMNWCNQKIFQMLQANENNFARAINSITDNTVSSLQRDYLKLLTGLRRSGKQVVSCEAVNFVNVWFIKLVFPHARIICTHRNIEDQILEIFCNNIPWMEYLNDLSAIAKYCRTAAELMDYWYKLFGDDIVRFNYDEFVAEPDVGYQNLLAALKITEYQKVEFTRVNTPSLNVREVYSPEIPLHEAYSEFTAGLLVGEQTETEELKLNFSNFDTAETDTDTGFKLNFGDNTETKKNNNDSGTEGFKLNF